MLSGTSWRSLRAIEVPANASRFLPTRSEALVQDVAVVRLAWADEDPLLFNEAFDPSLISHDDSYCTSVVDLDGVVQVPTAAYFEAEVLPRTSGSARVVDIGCGQGEFVSFLRARGLDAVGFDPVVREPTAYLHDDYWTPGAPDGHADVFVMRCVLPHIDRPWDFLREIGQAHPGSLVLVEFQRLEWILDETIWYQISHDHVNLFSARDFEDRFSVEAQGTFSYGEWAWVLLRAGSDRPAEARSCDVGDRVESILAAREITTARAAELARPLAIWGAAGKGIVLAHALARAGARLQWAVDADPVRRGFFLEASGVPVLSVDDALEEIPEGTTILVCNPNHLPGIRERHGDRWDLVLPRDFAAGPPDQIVSRLDGV
jgi:SAM-dependent methyltransferase